MTVSLSSEELNFVVYRYLLESGFTHTAFVFGYESQVQKSEIIGDSVPAGALITTFQKGLQYLELEANLAAEDAEADSAAADYSSLTARELITKDLEELKVTLAQRNTRAANAAHRSRRSERAEKAAAARDGGAAGANRGGTANGGTDVARPDASGAAANGLQIAAGQVTTLEGHTNEVFICAWSPTANMLASGSGDSTARIWDLSRGRGSPLSTALPHKTDKNQQSKDVTTLDWNGDGSLLATGSYDGIARIWSRTGELKNVLSAHKGPIFSLKWNKQGDLLLSGSVDKTAIIWDGATGQVKQQFECHSAPTLDVDWRDNTSFASCSTDKHIYVCQMGQPQPLVRFEGHTDEVNAVKWDPSGMLLASCSDDGSAKIWRVDSAAPMHDFTAHSKEIFTINWSPTGPGSANPGMRQMLVTASFDHTIRLWDTETGACVNHLTAHTQPVYSVAFSPNGLYLASGSFDKMVDIWNVKDGKLIKTYKGLGGIFEVCWNKDGDKIAACFSNKTVSVIDLKGLQ